MTCLSLLRCLTLLDLPYGPANICDWCFCGLGTPAQIGAGTFLPNLTGAFPRRVVVFPCVPLRTYRYSLLNLHKNSAFALGRDVKSFPIRSVSCGPYFSPAWVCQALPSDIDTNTTEVLVSSFATALVQACSAESGPGLVGSPWGPWELPACSSRRWVIPVQFTILLI